MSYFVPVTELVAAAIIVLRYLLGISQDPREIPFVPQKLLYVGDLVGVLRDETRYYNNVRLASQLWL